MASQPCLVTRLALWHAVIFPEVQTLPSWHMAGWQQLVSLRLLCSRGRRCNATCSLQGISLFWCQHPEVSFTASSAPHLRRITPG